MPFKIIRNDITKVPADIIVNSANPEPVYANGTDAAIYEAAGKEQLLISTGVYQFPRDKALQTAVMAISGFLLKHDLLVILVVFDRKSFEKMAALTHWL